MRPLGEWTAEGGCAFNNMSNTRHVIKLEMFEATPSPDLAYVPLLGVHLFSRLVPNCSTCLPEPAICTLPFALCWHDRMTDACGRMQ